MGHVLDMLHDSEPCESPLNIMSINYHVEAKLIFGMYVLGKQQEVASVLFNSWSSSLL